MLNPAQLSEQIDRHITAGAAGGSALDINAVTSELLNALDDDDRRGLDPHFVRDRILARSITLAAVR